MSELGMTGTSLLCLLAFMVLGAMACTFDTIRMRREAQRLMREAREHAARTAANNVESARLLADAYAVHEAAVAYSRDAVRRWLRVVSTETRVH